MLELDRINSFYGRAHILHDLSLSVAEGEVVALLGRNGAGKSTTMKSIMRLVAAKSGKISYAGRDITALPPHNIAKLGVGYVPEERRIFTDLTILENLEVGRQTPRAGAPEWTPGKLFKLFPNLEERRNNLGGAMSGGEQQMLTIARTLMGNPKFVLLDEPSEGLAPVIVEQVAFTIRELKKLGLTILLSEQNLHFAKLVADRAYIIERGSVQYDGTIEELENNEEVRNAYLSV
ncbi:ABC transporter ATP-binding protein [Pelagibius sp. Alg239-R121]|uniref:ABC transporter ATP-binding protein n=1 Tax=Pelagibius sp. Alg239-R121 TaxID=2993448 RepID=UPI0024A64F02|nr:ABC transporter ATP-binding protein [Pelagibius sp. Alg239-R121]